MAGCKALTDMAEGSTLLRPLPLPLRGMLLWLAPLARLSKVVPPGPLAPRGLPKGLPSGLLPLM